MAFNPFSLSKHYAVISLIFLSGCSHEGREIVKLREIDGEFAGKEISISTFIYNPNNIKIMDNMLVVHDRVEDNIFKFFSFPNVKYLFSWGKIGEGPDEIGYVNSSGFLARGNTFSFVDKNVFKTYKINTSNKVSLSSKVHLTDTQGLLNGVNLPSDSLFIASLVDESNPQSEHVFLHPGMKRGYTFGEFPEEGLEFDSYRQKVVYYHKSSVVNQDRKRIMIFYIRLNLLKIYDFEGRILKEIEFDEYSPPGKNIYWTTFGNSHATKNYVYVLYSKSMRATNFEEFESLPYDRDLLILNWEGEVIKRYHLNIPIIDFAVSEKHKKLYGLTYDGGDKIIEFDLPEL